ncbi:MAG: radical SAM protein [Planctomycetota bacterium]|nr:MAG: radical SAM protein [Planctomycetota bacterium]
MRVFCLNAPFHRNYSSHQRSPAVTKSRTLYYPIWLAYAAGLLETHGFEVSLVDGPGEDIDLAEAVRRAQAFRPELVAVATSTPSIRNDIRAAEAIAEATGAYTILVGTHTSARPEETLARAPGVRAVTRKEYDWTLLDLARHLEGGGGDPEGIAGLTYRAADGALVATPDRPEQADISELPHVARVYRRHLYGHWKRYFYAITRSPVVAIITGRGCPYRCNYCLFPQTLTGHGYRRRPVEAVVDEFKFIEREFPGVREVFIEDDTLTVDRKRCRRLAEEMIRRRVRVRWTANARCDVDYETLRLMRRAGLRLLCVGVESADQEILDAVEKRIRVDQIERFFSDAKRADVLVHGCFMVGNPGETRQSLQRTLEFAKRLEPDTAQFFPLMVYPGTRAYEWAEREGLLETTSDYDRWLTPEGLHRSVVHRPGLPSEELRRFCDRARREYYLRPRYVLRKLRQVSTDPYEARRTVKSFVTFARYLFHRDGGVRPAAGRDPAA